MKTIACKQVLTADGWREAQAVRIGTDGRIAAIEPLPPATAMDADILVPAPANLHSHAFQRAMAGMTEGRGPGGQDSFWTWRSLMYRFVDALQPDDVEAIAALMQMESLESGFGSVVEFHYVHHQPGGCPYDRPAEMGERIMAAADQTGAGLTLLPVLYQQGGCDGRPLEPEQTRFGCDLALYETLLEATAAAMAALPSDARTGLAAHSLRAVDRDGLQWISTHGDGQPIHIHAAEQMAEVEAVEAAYGARPVAWLLENLDPGPNWCLVHATQMTPDETLALAKSCAVAGLCPITESNLGDGIFDGQRFSDAGGRFGVGTDSNIQIDLAAELRTLEYSLRLSHNNRASLADATRSTGRRLVDEVARGGAQAAGRGAGAIEPGSLADLVALDGDAIDLLGKRGDMVLDAWIFANREPAVRHVWSAGRHVVRDGRHIARDAIRARYTHTLKTLGERM